MKNDNGDTYSDDKIFDIIKKNSIKKSERIFSILSKDIMSFLGSNKIIDDLTYLIIEFWTPIGLGIGSNSMMSKI